MSRLLPQDPSLEHLKNEAKALFKGHKSGDARVCKALRHLRRFTGASDQEILAADVLLNEAQFALALEYGFKSWQELKAYVDAIRDGGTGASRPQAFGEAEAWTAVRGSVEEFEKLPDDVRSKVLSITVAGSLVRGDFLADRSGVEIYTLYEPSMREPWTSDAHMHVRRCFHRHFGPYRGLSSSPNVWEDLCLEYASLPLRPERAGRHRLKAMGIYYFDFVKHHRTVWGEDFTGRLPEPVDPRPLVPERLEWLAGCVETVRDEGLVDWGRLPIITSEVVRALQVYFSEEPAIHKSEVVRRYNAYVPDFPEKSFGLDVWDAYVSGAYEQWDQLPRSFEEYHAFVLAAREVVATASAKS